MSRPLWWVSQEHACGPRHFPPLSHRLALQPCCSPWWCWCEHLGNGDNVFFCVDLLLCFLGVILCNCDDRRFKRRSEGWEEKKKKRIKIWETKGREVLRELQSVTSIKAREKWRPISAVTFVGTTGHFWFLRQILQFLVSSDFKAFFKVGKHHPHLIHGK